MDEINRVLHAQDAVFLRAEGADRQEDQERLF